MFISDQETAVDLLYYESIAKTVVRLVRETPDVPITVGVHGDWGAGKSSILKMAAATLAADKRTLCIWFNGWAFEGFEDAKLVLIENLIEEVKRARSTSTKVMDAAKKLFKRIDYLKVAHKLGGLAFAAFTGIPTLEQLKTLYDNAKSFVDRPLEHIKAEDIKAFVSGAGGMLKPAEQERLPEQIHAFREEFEKLIGAADIDQLVVLIDDLDRCLPETAIATLEAIRLFLFVPRTAFVIASDEAMIEYAVRRHFPDLPLAAGPIPYARNYLEKLIQVPFRIPALGLAETRTFVTLLLAATELDENGEPFKKLLALARQDLQRPWVSKGLTREGIRKALGNLPPSVDMALQMSEQITRLLTDGTRGNPRQIKRFLNTLMLRRAIAAERGFENEIQLPVLAKLMLAERFATEFYDEIARMAASATDGKPQALGTFESEVRRQPAGAAEKTTKGKKADTAAEASPQEIKPWLESEWMKSWALIDPTLSDVDLRPYVFVSRDKRGLLGTPAASHLDAIVERLMGKPMAMRAIGGEITKLTGTEPEQVFEAVRARVTQADKLSDKPAGVDGLAYLVELHPALQRRLLEFLSGLPPARLGSWAPSSWANCFGEESVRADFTALVQTWSVQSENVPLKTAAGAVLKLQQKK